MKRNLLLKCLIFAVVVVAAIMVRGDLIQPTYTYHALSRSAWENAIQALKEQEREKEIRIWLEKTGVSKLGDMCRNIPIVLILAGPFIFGTLTCVYLCRAIRLRRRKYLVGTAITSFLLILSVAIWFLGTIPPLMEVDYINIRGSTRDRDILVEPKLGETYEEYKRRVYEYDNPYRHKQYKYLEPVSPAKKFSKFKDEMLTDQESFTDASDSVDERQVESDRNDWEERRTKRLERAVKDSQRFQRFVDAQEEAVK